MYTLRCTKRLLARLRPSLARECPVSTTRLGDWYANLVQVGRKQLVLAVSAPTLLPILMPAAPVATLPDRMPTGVAEMLGALRIATRDIDDEIAAMNEVMFATTINPRVVGILVDFARLLPFYMEKPGTLLDHALHLARTPCSPLARPNTSPDLVTLALFGGSRLRVVR